MGKLVENVRELYQALADGKTLQCRYGENKWTDFDPERESTCAIGAEFDGYNKTSNLVRKWRVKPPSVTVSGSYPEPVRDIDAMEHDSYYWWPCGFTQSGVEESTWHGMTFDTNLLKRGLVHLSRENAQLHADAIFGKDC